MSKPSHRQAILTEGLRLVHARGFAAASVRDITQAAGAPKGSFTNHFASKDAFGLEILDLYFTKSIEIVQATLRNRSLKPMQRLHAYIDHIADALAEDGWRNGCLLGNFSTETSEHNEAIRVRLIEIFDVLREAVAECLADAVQEGEMRPCSTYSEFADFLITALQGAILRARVERSAVPLERFKHFIFSAAQCAGAADPHGG